MMDGNRDVFTMSEMILSFLIFFGGALAYTTALGQMAERKKNTANYIIFALLFCIGSWQIYHGFMVTGILVRYPHLAMAHLPFLYFTGPLLYFYFKVLSRENYRMAKKDYFHFLPGVIIILILIPFYAENAEFKQALLASPLNIRSGSAYIFGYTMMIFMLIAGISGYIIYFIRSSSSIFSMKYLRLKQIRYLSLLIIGTSIIIVICYFTGLVLYTLFSFSRAFYLTVMEAISLMTTLTVFITYLTGRRYPNYFTVIQREAEKVRYEKSRIGNLDVAGLLTRLNRLMDTDKLYRDEDISLRTLSRELSIESYQLSQILNEKLNKNFNTFINEHRVEDAKKLLLDDPDRSVTSIAYASGFNSPSSFYDWFMKIEGCSPSKFRERQKKDP